MKLILAFVSIILLDNCAQAQTVNRRPSNETGYTIGTNPADCAGGNWVVSTSPTAQVTWTLPANCSVKIRNGGANSYLLIAPVAGVTINGDRSLRLTLRQGAELAWDGISDYQTIVGWSGVGNANGQAVFTVGNSGQTQASIATLSGNPASNIGKVVGFDYAFTWQSTNYNFQFRHTIASGDTLASISADLLTQLKANTTIAGAIGEDVFYNSAATLAVGTNYWIYWNQSWPFSPSANPSLTGYADAGSTVIVTTQLGSPKKEADAGYVCGNTTPGRTPLIDDLLCGIWIVGDTAAGGPSIKDATPFLWTLAWTMRDTGIGTAYALGNMEGATAFNGKQVTGDLTSYTANLTCDTGGPPSPSTAPGFYKQVDKLVFVKIHVTITANGNCAGHVRAALPFAAATPSGSTFLFGASENMGYSLNGYIAPGGTFVYISKFDNSYPGYSGAYLTINGWYDSAQ